MRGYHKPMGNRILLKHCLTLLLMAVAAQAAAHDPGDCGPRMQEGWVRMPPRAMPMMAGFGRITNPCKVPMAIVAVSSPAFGSVSLHETRNVDGVNRMRELDQLRLAPDGVAMLKPGGLHLMLMQPRAPLKEGSKVVMSFKLQDGREILSELVVRKPAP